MNKGLDKWDLCFVIYMFLSNNPSSGDINSSNLSCFYHKLGKMSQNLSSASVVIGPLRVKLDIQTD